MCFTAESTRGPAEEMKAGDFSRVAKDALGTENVAAIDAGFANLARHVENLRNFGLPVVVGDAEGWGREHAQALCA